MGLKAGFRWRIPDLYNIGVDVCDRWAALEPDRVAILDVSPDGDVAPLTYGEMREASNRLANALRHRGIGAGDRVGILLQQSATLAIVHIAVYKLGAIAVPLATLFGPEGLCYRLSDAGACALITNDASLPRVRAIAHQLPDLATIISVDGADGAVLGLPELLAGASSDFTPAQTSADDPALMIYTSGTTGQPKGALHAHRVLLGHLPGVQMPHHFLPQPGDRFWTPADWAWAGGLLNALLPCLHLGVPVVARKHDKFDPEAAFRLMADLGIRNAFIPPTALRMMRSVRAPRARFRFELRSVASAGEALGTETVAWGAEALGVPINDSYGQTECNLVLGSCAQIGVARPGTIGRTIPGHRVAIIWPDGSRSAPGEVGQIAVRWPDPVMFLGYWGQDAATDAKFIGDWMTTGDQGIEDADGYVRFIGRDDDLITSAGYRIGPVEVEDCLLRHPAVALAAVIGKPDGLRTEIVKAFVVPKEGFEPTEALATEIQAFVRERLSAHEYPREIAFRAELPLTTSGKVIRRVLRDEG